MLLGLDVGTSNVKVGVYARDGSLLAHAEGVTPRGVSEGFENYLPDALWQTVAALIKEVVATANVEVEALAVSSMAEAGLPLDHNGEPTYPIIPWNDLRAERYLHRLVEKLEPARWYATPASTRTPSTASPNGCGLKRNSPRCGDAAAPGSARWVSYVTS